MTHDGVERNVYFFDRRRRLKIRNIGRDNEGSYSCKAENLLGSQTSDVLNVNVLCEYDNYDDDYYTDDRVFNFSSDST